ncbi:PH domain-containing protein [Bacillus sp. RG28]|uniref:PH domain-containing protein n=1 Tax=Gottfriedia endophytica TaxID=2820819 RepID=A0A940NH94_9BACI|nr:PH domain-containing protein [Gottfriedia endophytica]MBP0724002.1 PH domain-containing protein [Gottfriedia endophytica]
MKFPVKKNPILIFITVAMLPLSIFILVTGLLIKDDIVAGIIGFIITFMLFIFLGYPIKKSYHEITETDFYAVFGWMKIKIPLADITKVNYTWNPISAPAWTFKRMQVSYGRYGFDLLSIPKNEEQFFTLLKERCPNAFIDIDKKRD